MDQKTVLPRLVLGGFAIRTWDEVAIATHEKIDVAAGSGLDYLICPGP